MEKENEQANGLRLNLTDEVAAGIYSNLVMISHSTCDFVLDFSQALPGMQQPRVASRIVMAPEHAKRLAAALQENIYKYEREFGKITIPGSEPTVIDPFRGQGQA